ncbi:MAG: ComE operon protein 3 [Candidatus Omnitrophica bacterium]|nr:ComE operon protein 3 [Candidatus Omnitrophota bacterium]
MRRRPLFYLGLAAVIGAALGTAIHHPSPEPRLWWTALAGLGAGIASWRGLGSKATTALLVMLLASGGYGALRGGQLSDAGRLARGPEAITALGGTVVSEVVRTEGLLGTVRESCLVRVERLWPGAQGDGQRAGGLVRASLPGPTELDRGDQVVLSGWLRPPRTPTNPGGFDAATYLRARGCDALFYADKAVRPKILRKGAADAWERSLDGLRRSLSDQLERHLSAREAAFVRALVFGERTEMGEAEKELFLRTGTAHILAVSGFNVGFVYAVVQVLCRLLLVPRRAVLVLSGVAIWGYCLLVGWQAPLVRAAIMASVYLAAQWTGRRGDPLNSLGLAALIILAVNPWQVWDAGFQLSFVAVLALGVALPRFWEEAPVARTLKSPALRLKEAALSLFWVSYACLVFTLPLSAHYFYIASPVAVLSNLVVVPLTFVIFCAGLLVMAAGLAGAALQIISQTTAAALELMLAALRMLDALPGSVCTVGRPPAPVLFLLYAVIAWALIDRRLVSRGGRALGSALGLTCVLLAQSIAYALPDGRLHLTALDVGQGEALHLRLPRGGDVLIDGGQGGRSDKGKWVILPYFKSKGISDVDLIVLTHPHEDHAGGLPAVIRQMPVRAYLTGPFAYDDEQTLRIEQALDERRVAVRPRVGAGDRIEDYGGVDLEVLYPPRTDGGRARKLNDESLVLAVRHGRTRALLAADVERLAMRRMLEWGTDLGADLLKVPHHGGWPGGWEPAAWLARVAMRHALISCGERNMFGHPAPQMLDALRSGPGAEVHRTDLEGAVTLISDGRSYTRG